jgi:hypothetical protein
VASGGEVFAANCSAGRISEGRGLGQRGRVHPHRPTAGEDEGGAHSALGRRRQSAAVCGVGSRPRFWNRHGRLDCSPQGNPRSFVWQGDQHRVESIEDVREPRLDWWSVTGEIHRTYYLVITNHGLICEVFRDEAGTEGRVPGSWPMSRVFD